MQRFSKAPLVACFSPANAWPCCCAHNHSFAHTHTHRHYARCLHQGLVKILFLPIRYAHTAAHNSLRSWWCPYTFIRRETVSNTLMRDDAMKMRAREALFISAASSLRVCWNNTQTTKQIQMATRSSKGANSIDLFFGWVLFCLVGPTLAPPTFPSL